MLCGERMKRMSLELGGKSAAIVLDDVDLTAVGPLLVGASCMNNGEACVNQTRVLAPRARYAEVIDALRDGYAAMTIGDPFDAETDVGPLISERQRDRVEGYIASGSDEGAKLAVGGGRPGHLDRGWYVEPTVFYDVAPSMRIAREEIFGPVVAVIPYDDVEDAITIANDTLYGFSGTVWTANLNVGLEIARRVRGATAACSSKLNHASRHHSTGEFAQSDRSGCS
jgi:betaine-aldehyde dehydrogenase